MVGPRHRVFTERRRAGTDDLEIVGVFDGGCPDRDEDRGEKMSHGETLKWRRVRECCVWSKDDLPITDTSQSQTQQRVVTTMMSSAYSMSKKVSKFLHFLSVS